MRTVSVAVVIAWSVAGPLSIICRTVVGPSAGQFQSSFRPASVLLRPAGSAMLSLSLMLLIAPSVVMQMRLGAGRGPSRRTGPPRPDEAREAGGPSISPAVRGKLTDKTWLS